MPKYLVVHPSQHLMTDVGGKVKLRHVPKGSEVTLDEKAAASLVAKKRLVLASESNKVKVSTPKS